MRRHFVAAPGLPQQRSALRTAWPWLAAIASGVLLALSFPPTNLGGLIWIALTPLICAVWFRRARSTPRRSFALGYVAGLVFFATTFSWLHALGTLFEVPFLHGIPLLLGAFLALYPAAWCWFLDRIAAPDAEQRRFPNSWRNLALGALGACAWTALEWVRSWFLYGFSWNGLGVALHRDLPMIQIAEITGTYGLTWLVAFVNLMSVIVVRRLIGEFGLNFIKRVRWEFTITVTLVVIVFSFGIRRLFAQPPGELPTHRIAAIQPNVPQSQKFDAAFEDEVFAQLERLTLVASATNPDLIVWPEAATPRGMFADQINWDFVQRMTASAKCPLLVGTVENYYAGAQPESFNSAVLLVPGTSESTPKFQTHRKMHLVPFGEFLPMRPLLGSVLGELVPGDVDPGKEIVVMETPVGKTGALICFEDTNGDLTRRFVLAGAQLLVNLTNDGWFLRTAGPEVHLANAVLRAVENRRPLIRCTNTGVTCLVDPMGRIDRRLAPHRQGFAVHPVRITAAPLTLYARHGDWIVWLSCATTVLAAAHRWRMQRRPDTKIEEPG